MRLTLYSSYYLPYISGMTVYAHRILSELSGKHKVKVITFSYKEGLSTSEILDGITIIRMPYWFRISKGFISFHSWSIFFNACRNSDIILLNIPNAEALPLAILAKIMQRKIISLYYCDVVLDKNYLNKVIEFFLNISVYIQLMLASEIIMLPGYIEQSALGKFFLDKISIIPPPIKHKHVHDKKIKSSFKYMKGKSIWIGFVGRLSREKGIEYLIAATKQLQIFNRNVTLVLAGPSGDEVAGEEDYLIKINKLLNETKIKYRTFGFLSENRLCAFFSSLDVLVLPSINKTEAFGMVQVEAMIHGTPVVASDIAGVKTAVTVTSMGELALPKNAVDLANKIKLVLKNSALYRRKTNTVKHYYSLEKTLKMFEEILAK